MPTKQKGNQIIDSKVYNLRHMSKQRGNRKIMNKFYKEEYKIQRMWLYGICSFLN